MTDIDFSAFQGLLTTRTSDDTKDVFARFYDRSVKTDEMNAKTGLPIFKNKCFVEIRIKNNNTDIYDQPANDEKINRFPVEYNRYLLCKKQTQEGSPIEQFSFLNAAQTDTLKYHGIFTLEALGALTDQQAQDLDIVSECERAKAFLSKAKQDYNEQELYTKCCTLEDEINRLKALLSEDQSKQDELVKKERKPRKMNSKQLQENFVTQPT